MTSTLKKKPIKKLKTPSRKRVPVKKKSSIAPFFTTFLILAISAGGGWYYWTNMHKPQSEKETPNAVSKKVEKTTTEPIADPFEEKVIETTNKTTQPKPQVEPLLVYSEENFSGSSEAMNETSIYTSENIPSQLNSNISSLTLKQGFQLTISVNPDGSGLSKVLIAAKRDIRIPRLSDTFNNRIQFLRILPWKDTIKKGHGGKDAIGLNEGWYYTWTDNPSPILQEEVPFIPMPHSHHKTNNAEWVQNLIQNNNKWTDILGFNEPDMPGQHHKNKFLGIQKNSATAMLPLMKSGIRIGGPSCTENGPKKWYPAFMEEAKQQKLRIDFMGVHWYDWGGVWGNKANNPKNSTPEKIFERFQKYIENTYKQYQLPLWVTEFNANPKRDTATQLAFMKLALPYLDSLPYVERYAWFQPFTYSAKGTAEDSNKMDKTKGSGDFRQIRTDPSTPLTQLGLFWKNHQSVPTITKEVYLGKNNLCDDEIEEL